MQELKASASDYPDVEHQSIPGPATPGRAASRKLRVLAISHSAVHRASGRMRYERLHELRRDIDFTLVVPDRWREYGREVPLDPHTGTMDFRVERVRLQSIPKVGWYAHHYPGLSRLLMEVRPDVIHAWEEPWSVVGLQIVRARNRLLPDAAVILESDQNILRVLPPPFEQIRRFTLRNIDLIVGRNEDCHAVARSCGFTGPTATVEYGVAPDIFWPNDHAGARAELGAAGFTIGYVGRVVREKGLDDVLDAMAACPALVTLLVLGGGPDSEALQARAAELGLAERVRLLPPRPPAQVARFINGLDALVLMSRTTRTWKEQFGRVIMEAHACGVPVIGSDSGAIPSVVADGGWIVPEGDATALAGLLERLSAAPSEVALAGAAGRKQATTRFSIDTVAGALGDSWDAAFAARSGKRHPKEA